MQWLHTTGKAKPSPNRKEDNAMEKWIFVAHYEHCGVGFDEYINADGTLVKQVWHDGYTEIFEKA